MDGFVINKVTQIKKYALWLWILFTLFCVRVASQLLQAKFSITFLPAFDAWHSGALPYTYLVIFQLIIIFIYGFICIQFSSGKVNPSKTTGIMFLSIGSVYLCAMIVRLLIGLFFSSSTWFHAYLSIVFHYILALFLILVGVFHLKFYDAHEQ